MAQYLKKPVNKNRLRWSNLGLASGFLLVIMLSGLFLKKDEVDVAIASIADHRLTAPIVAPFTVFVDPGHGGYDGGMVNDNGVLEKDINIIIGNMIYENLKGIDGLEIIMSRTTDEVVWPSDNIQDLQMRIDLAVAAEADLFVSLHCNANDQGAYGLEVWHTDLYAQEAELFGKHFKTLDFIYYRGLRNTRINPLHVLDFNPLPSVLIEYGFLTDPDDEAYLIDYESQLQLAKKTSDAIIEYKNNHDVTSSVTPINND